MKIIMFICTGILLILNVNSFAQDKQKQKVLLCNIDNYCVSSNYFNAQLKSIRKRGNIVVAQIRYTGKSGVRYAKNNGVGYDDTHIETNWGNPVGNYLKATFDKGYASLVDANGDEFRIDGKDINSFNLTENQDRTLSLIFRGSGKKTLEEPFDIFVKGSAQHGEISFFELSSDKFKVSIE